MNETTAHPAIVESIKKDELNPGSTLKELETIDKKRKATNIVTITFFSIILTTLYVAIFDHLINPALWVQIVMGIVYLGLILFMIRTQNKMLSKLIKNGT